MMTSASIVKPSLVSSAISTRRADSIAPGPLLDDGALFCAIGVTEFQMLIDLDPISCGALESIPESITGFEWWQDEHGQHYSENGKILGSIPINFLTDEGWQVEMTYLLIEGSSLWVIGSNVISVLNILQARGDCLQLPECNSVRSKISLKAN